MQNDEQKDNSVDRNNNVEDEDKCLIMSKDEESMTLRNDLDRSLELFCLSKGCLNAILEK